MTVLDTAGAAQGTQAGQTNGHPHVSIFADRCAGCQECVVRCPEEALSMNSELWIAVADESKCVGCRQCVRTCPFSAITVSGPLIVTARTAVTTQHPARIEGDVSETRSGFSTWDEALAEASRCLSCPDPTCVRGCPAHNDIPGFISAVADKDLERAHTILRRTTLLPDVCSRVCDQSAQCEGACSWSLAGGTPVAIGAIERFITEQAPVPPLAKTSSAGDDLSVAVVGAGPAGIAAAWDLASAGAQVTVFEKDDNPGGLLRWGIPDFTLPEAVADRAWDQLRAAGVTLECGKEVAAGDLDELLSVHDAVVLTVGAGVPMRLPVPGGDLNGVVDATSFLHASKAVLDGEATLASVLPLVAPAAGEAPQVDRAATAGAHRILVLGGGNTAMDVARSARRLGIEATCVEWLDRRFAPVRPDELAEAEAEGVEVRFLHTLVRLEGGDGPAPGTATAGRSTVRRAYLATTIQESPTTLPKVQRAKPVEVPVDMVVMAMGYRNDPDFTKVLPGTPLKRVAPAGVPDRSWMASGVLAGPASPFAHSRPVGTLALGREVGIQAAALPFRDRLFAAGDAVVGPSTVVEAMAQGRAAVRSLLASQPRRPGRPTVAPSRVLVCYESNGGRTETAARAIAGALTGRGAQVTALPLKRVGARELAAADVVIVGSWVEGFVVAGVHPARRARDWLAALPHLGGKKAAVFCTYAVSPKAALAEMAAALEKAGADVVAHAGFSRNGAPSDAVGFARELLALCWPAGVEAQRAQAAAAGAGGTRAVTR